MVFRLLQTLEQERWITRVTDDPKYAMTLVPFHFASLPVARMDVVIVAQEPLMALWKRTGECVYLGGVDLTHRTEPGSVFSWPYVHRRIEVKPKN